MISQVAYISDQSGYIHSINMTCTEDTAIPRVYVGYANSDNRRDKTYVSPLVLVADSYSYSSSVVSIVFVSFYIPTQKYAASLRLVAHVQQY